MILHLIACLVAHGKYNFMEKHFSWPCVLWLWPGNWFTFLFSLQTISGSQMRKEREREREERVTDPPKIDRTLAPAPPSRSHHHRDRTPPRLHHHWRLICPKSISLALLLPMANLITLSISSLPMIDLVSISSLPMTDLVAHDLWPISPFPSIFDHSLFLPLLVWPNCGV